MPLNNKLQEFYGEVLAQERQLAAGAPPADVREKLVALLARQQHESERDEGHYGAEVYARAKYLFAALADEVLLRPDSPARDAWMGHLLEAAVFRSQRAGEKFFEIIEDLASDRGPASAELASICLYILGLGFEGKYRDRSDAPHHLADARRKLFHIIYKRDPRPLREDDRLVPDAYAETAEDAVGSELPYRRPWIWALAIVILLWLGASHALWRNAISDLEPLIDEVFEASSAIRPVAEGGH